MPCKAEGCQDQHVKHFCKNCSNKDSDHLARNCPKQGAVAKVRCGIDGCKENHTQRFCKICKNKNANHKASACPSGSLVMHATAKTNLPLIAKSGLKPSQGGRLGPGMYFFSNDADQENMVKIMTNRFTTPAAVLHCNVYLGQIKRIYDGSDVAGSWQANHDSCQARHPVWAGTGSNFSEWCVKDDKRCKILKVEIPADNVKIPWNKYVAQL